MKLSLPNVTLVCVDCVNPGAALVSLKKSMAQVDFGEVRFLTNTEINIDGIEVVKISKINSKEEYSEFIVKELYKYIRTDYLLIVQHDSWVLNADCWDNENFNCDYIGARWGYDDGDECGNGGFSFRSKKLQEALCKDDFIQITHPEDVITGRVYKRYLQKKYDIKYPPNEVCDKFAFELREPTQKTFGFHSFFHPPFKEHIVIKRTAAMGDLIMVEPLISYYHNKGYQIVLDTLPEFMGLFYNHPYKIKHISQMNADIKPLKVINLDQTYEVLPKERVLDVYYKFAGITDGEMRNNRLHVNQHESQKLFQKYILIHCDETGLPHRNQYGINWEFVVNYLSRLGFLVLQIGKRTTQHIAPHFNAETKEMLMYIIKGADLVIGLDSGIAQLSVALGVPTAIFFGSVDPKLRYQGFSKIEIIQNECPVPEYKNCYHSQDGSTTGVECKINKEQPICCTYSQWDVIKAVNKLLKTE